MPVNDEVVVVVVEVVGGFLVVDAAEEPEDGREAEEVVGVGEEAHASDDDGLEVVPLGPRRVEGIKDF